MNKIYSDQIEKVNLLVGGIEKNAAELKTNKINVDTQQLKKAIAQLTEIAKKQDAADATLKQIRTEAHKKLDELKELYDATKMPIKGHFSLEKWANFGIPDKR